MSDGDFDAYYDAWTPFLRDFERETDRAAIILGAARLDIALTEHLKRVLLAPSRNEETLLEPERPLGSFGARIELAYRLGLIDRPFRDALDLLRRMRNDSAHKLASCSLEQGPQADRAHDLIRLHHGSVTFEEFHNASRYRVPDGLPGDFRIALAGMMLRLERQAPGSASPLVREPIRLLPDHPEPASAKGP